MKLLENSVLDSISAALSMDTGDLKIAGRYVCVCFWRGVGTSVTWLKMMASVYS